MSLFRSLLIGKMANGGGYTPPTPASRLPDGYEEYQWYHNNVTDGRPYIDTGLLGSMTQVWELTAFLTRSNEYPPIGTGNTKSDGNFSIWLHNKSDRKSVEGVFGNGANASYSVEQSMDVTTPHTYRMELANGTLYVDGVLAGTATTIGTMPTPKTLPLLGCWRGNSVYSSFESGYLGETKIWDDGALVRHYVPALRLADNAPGMYDLCNSTAGDAGTPFYVITGGTGGTVVKSEWFEPLCFTAQENGCKVRLVKEGSPAAISLKYSTDKSNWSSYSVNTDITLTNAGDKVYFKGDNSTFSQSNVNYYHFVFSKATAASGNIMSLLDSGGASLEIPCSYCFYKLFYSCANLLSLPSLPATKLKSNCYCYMCYGCTSIVAGPALPAPDIADANYCYDRMLSECSSLASVDCNFTVWESNYQTYHWLSGVAASGTFKCPAGLDTTTRDASHVPSGWTVVTKQ